MQSTRSEMVCTLDGQMESKRRHRPKMIKRVSSGPETQTTRYFVDPAILRNLQFASETTLKRIEPHRLAALVLEDLARYPQSAISDIHQRIGGEIHPKQVERTLEELTAKGSVRFEGDKRWPLLGAAAMKSIDKTRRYRTTLGDTVWVIHRNSPINQRLLSTGSGSQGDRHEGQQRSGVPRGGAIRRGAYAREERRRAGGRSGVL